MTSRLSFPCRSLTALAFGAALLGVSACGGSSSSQVSPAVISKLESVLEQNSISAPKAAEIAHCLVPALKAHGITTLADANALKTAPAWLHSATVSCAEKALTPTSTTSTGG